MTVKVCGWSPANKKAPDSAGASHGVDTPSGMQQGAGEHIPVAGSKLGSLPRAVKRTPSLCPAGPLLRVFRIFSGLAVLRGQIVAGRLVEQRQLREPPEDLFLQ